MIISNKSAMFFVCLSCIVVIGLFWVKYLTITLEDGIKKSKIEIAKCKKDHRILMAEWKAVTDPNRIQKLSEKYLQQINTLVPAKIVKVPVAGCCAVRNGDRREKLSELISECNS